MLENRKNELLLKDDHQHGWKAHVSDGHSYQLVESMGFTLLMAAPTQMDGTPDERCAYWVDIGEHFTDEDHIESFCGEVSTLLGFSPETIRMAIE